MFRCKDGVELKHDGSHVQISEDGQTHTLVVHGVNRHDTAKYTCKITNKYGSNEDYGEMYVRCSPQFRSRLTDQKAKEGDTDVEFNVNIQAFPKPLVRWYVTIISL